MFPCVQLLKNLLARNGRSGLRIFEAAEFSRDSDFAILADAENLGRLRKALTELRAEVIAVPPFDVAYLEKGHADFFSGEVFHRDAGAPGSAQELAELGKVCVETVDDEFAAMVERQLVLFAEARQGAVALAGEARLEAVGGVVEAHVQDAAVTAAGVHAERAFLFEDDDIGIGEAAFEFTGDADADDAAADDEEVWMVPRRSSVKPSIHPTFYVGLPEVEGGRKERKSVRAGAGRLRPPRGRHLVGP